MHILLEENISSLGLYMCCSGLNSRATFLSQTVPDWHHHAHMLLEMNHMKRFRFKAKAVRGNKLTDEARTSAEHTVLLLLGTSCLIIWLIFMFKMGIKLQIPLEESFTSAASYEIVCFSREMVSLQWSWQQWICET